MLGRWRVRESLMGRGGDSFFKDFGVGREVGFRRREKVRLFGV